MPPVQLSTQNYQTIPVDMHFFPNQFGATETASGRFAPQQSASLAPLSGRPESNAPVSMAEPFPQSFAKNAGSTSNYAPPPDAVPGQFDTRPRRLASNPYSSSQQQQLSPSLQVPAEAMARLLAGQDVSQEGYEARLKGDSSASLEPMTAGGGADSGLPPSHEASHHGRGSRQPKGVFESHQVFVMR